MVRRGRRNCQSVRGDLLDAAVGDFVVAAVNRENLALSLTVRDQLTRDFETADRQRARHIEQLRYQADLARRRYMEVDPSNRLVAASLEAEWEVCLSAHSEAVQERQRYAKAHATLHDAELDRRIMALSNDFRRVWEAPDTTSKSRKRLLACLVEDATLTRNGRQVEVGLRMRGGHVHELPPVALPRPRAQVVRRDASKEVLAELDVLLEAGLNDAEAAETLNRRGRRDSLGGQFNASRIKSIRNRYNLTRGTTRQREKLRAQGYRTANELAAELGIHATTVSLRARNGQGIEACKIKSGKRHFAMYKRLPAA